MSDPRISKAYVAVGDGQVHYRRAGSGPPIVLLHDSPRSSLLHLDLMASLCDRYTVYALDTPGYGLSTPLPTGGRELEIADFADALAETVAALGLEKAGFYGFHTSSKILLDFTVRHPDRVAVALLDGLSIAPGGKPDGAFIDAYMRPFDIDADGAWLAREWTRVRDTMRWFPWFAPVPRSRMPIAQPDIGDIHDYFLDYALAGPHYAGAYRAAMWHQPLDNVSRLTVPTQVMARADDVLFGCLDLLPDPGPECLSVARLSADRAAWKAHIGTMFDRHRGAMAVGPAPLPPQRSGAGYIDLAHGQMRILVQPGRGRPVLCLHDLPGGATAEADLHRALSAGGRPVLAPDLPGCGASDPLPAASRKTLGRVVAEAVAALGYGEFDLVATGLSVPLGLEMLATGLPIRRAVLDGMPLLDAAAREAMLDYLAAPLVPDRAGGHLHRAFHALRDAAASFPAQDGSIPAVRSDSAILRPQLLYRRVMDMLMQPRHQGDMLRAAFADDAGSLLSAVTVPVLLPAVTGDPLYRAVDGAARRLSQATRMDRDPDPAARGAAFLGFLDG
ncbi:alpha/beta fold hydrolase [Niveispirillum fermenti]|uniref:alpha/beta fold hydrolase n=1 Tax=Niveispirillum fermenti TaxID=1233113 RepID=UPI003A84EE9E